MLGSVAQKPLPAEPVVGWNTRGLTFIAQSVGVEVEGRGCCPQTLLQEAWKGGGEQTGLFLPWEAPARPPQVSVGPSRQFFYSPYGPENFHLTPYCPAREEMETGLPPGRKLGVGGKRGALWNSLVRLEGAGEATVLLLPQQRPLVQTEAGARGRKEGDASGGGDGAER